MSTISYSGYEIPLELALLTGGTKDDFVANAEGQFAELRDKTGLDPSFSIVEIGCGVGRSAIPLSRYLTSGSYLGIDIIEPSIKWARENIGARHPNCKFVRFNVKDDLHNPSGDIETSDIVIPAPDKSVDRIILWSVFTHLFEAEISHYLREFRRIIKPTGKIWASCYVVTPDVLASVRADTKTMWSIGFPNEPEPNGCYINDYNVPRGAVGYSPEALRRIVGDAGFVMDRDFFRGIWCGVYDHPESGQDGMVLSPAL